MFHESLFRVSHIIPTIVLLPLVVLMMACGDKNKGTTAKPESAKTDSAPAAATSNSPMAEDDAMHILNSALDNMGKLTSYHAVADLLIGDKKARIEGEFAVGKVEFTVDRVDGQQTKYIIIGKDAYVSSDDGSTWGKDSSQSGVAMSTMVTAPVSPNAGLTADASLKTIGTEDVDGTPTTHVQVGAKSLVDVWIADEPNVGKVVRKIHLFTVAEDAEINTTITYSDFNKPVEIKVP